MYLLPAPSPHEVGPVDASFFADPMSSIRRRGVRLPEDFQVLLSLFDEDATTD
jgi:hypothetical protein